MFEGFSYSGISDFAQNPRMVWDVGDLKALPILCHGQGHSPGCSKGWQCAVQEDVQWFNAAVHGIFYLAEHPDPCMCSCAVLRSPPSGTVPCQEIPALRKGLTLISFALNFISCKFNANTARTRSSSAALGLLPALRAGLGPGQRNYSWEMSCAKKKECEELRNLSSASF